MVSVIICVLLAFIYLKRTPYIYSSATKVKVLDEKDGLEVPTEAFIFKRSQINLENESEIMKSYQILEQVVRDLNLTTQFSNTSGFRDVLLEQLPFNFKQHISRTATNHSGGFMNRACRWLGSKPATILDGRECNVCDPRWHLMLTVGQG